MSAAPNTDRFSEPMPWETEPDIETQQAIEAARADRWQDDVDNE